MLLAAVLLSAGCARPPAAITLSIAAAADLQFAMEEVSRQFHAAHPNVDLKMVYGSSGNFYTQILNQAPFDVFLSADLQYPRQLVQAGAAMPDSVFEYAVGRLAVWVPSKSPLDVATLQMKIFDDPSVRHIAIANPQHAPYGRAAEEALRHYAVYPRIAAKLVMAENIAQTLQYVQSGAADVGLVALSLAVAPNLRGQGRYWEIPLDAYPKLWQGGVVLKRAPASAADLRKFLTGPDGHRILKQYGFSLPEK